MQHKSTLLGLILLAISLLPFQIAEAAFYCANQQANIPSNEVVIRAITNTSCGNASGNIRLETRVPSASGSTTERCENYGGMPAGFVVIRVKGTNDSGVDCNGNNSGNGVRHTIRVPQDSSSTTTTICANQSQPLPAGYIINQVGSSNDCATIGSQPTYRIRKPRTGGTVDSICNQSTIPTGYVVVRNTRNTSSCSNNGTTQQYDIRTPGNNIWICGNYTGIPDGFAALQESSSRSDCTGFNQSGLAYRIGPPVHNTIVCGQGNVPSGFLKTEVNNFSQCDGSVGYRVFDIVQIASQLEYCTSGNDVPTGYVVTSIRSSNDCSTNSSATALTIRQPANGSVICANYPYPAGYAITSSGSSNSCSTGSGTGPTYTISQLQAGQSYCDSGSFTIPAGLVITQVTNDSSCPGAGRRITLNTPSTNSVTNICLGGNATMPAGYVITSINPSDSSCGISRQRTSIRLPYANSETTICSTSPVPNGYIVVQNNISVSFCGNIAPTASVIRSASTISGPFTICAGSSVPDGFVITAYIGNVNACGTLGGLEIRPIQSPIIACLGSPIPPSYIVLRYLNSSACQDLGANADNAFELRLPNTNGTTTTCSSVPPPGYVILRTESSSVCGLTNTAYVITSEVSLPAEFVDPIKNVIPGGVPAVNYDCGGSSQTGGFINGQPRNTAACP